MSRIKLPGKEKDKKRLLIILIIVVISILSYEAWISKNNKNKEQNEIVNAEIKEESNIVDSTNNIEDAHVDKSETDKGNNIKINEAEKSYSARENELYSEAYNLFFSRDYTNSIKKANTLISEFPNNAQGYNIRGIAKAYNGDFDGGMKDIDKSLNIDKNYGYARFNKALAYELYEKMDAALEWYDKALEIEEYVWSYYGIASIYGRRGDVTNTMAYLNKAIKIDSGVKEVAKTEHDFDPVKNSDEFKNAVYK